MVIVPSILYFLLIVRIIYATVYSEVEEDEFVLGDC